MQSMNREELVDLLDDLRQRVAEGASLEGNLVFRHTACVNDTDHYDVAATYRTSRRGVRMVGIKGGEAA
ncbi:hypothetical protein [Streptomyces nigrescens]